MNDHTPASEAAASAMGAPDRPDHKPSLRQRFIRAITGVPISGGASSTPSPTLGRIRGVSAPGVAETAQREGAPGRKAGAEGGPDPDKLPAVQRDILTAVRSNEPTADVAAQSPEPAIRRFTGDKRVERVGPLRFTHEERVRLQTSATAHGYRGESGFAADVTLAFIDGRFFVDLPLAEERRNTHIFRAQLLRALSRIGSNVNQIARAFNGGYEPSADIRHTLGELHHLLTEIAEALRQPAEQKA